MRIRTSSVKSRGQFAKPSVDVKRSKFRGHRPNRYLHRLCSGSQDERIEIQEWDIVLFKLENSSNFALGRVLRLNPARCIVELLKEGPDGLWVVTSEEMEIGRQLVKELVEGEYSQRQQERTLNPHGEHAEEVFTLRNLPEDIFGRIRIQ